MAPPGSKTLACKQSYFINEGDPIVSPGRSINNKPNKRENRDEH